MFVAVLIACGNFVLKEDVERKEEEEERRKEEEYFPPPTKKAPIAESKCVHIMYVINRNDISK